MFIGHFAVGFAAKKIAPSLSLGSLFIAAQFLDLLWPILLLTGLEHVAIDPGNTVMTHLHFYDYPISHSLVAVLAWSIVIGSAIYIISKNARNALVIGALIVSHWFLDLVMHRPDLPIFLQGGPYLGFGLWNSLTATVAVEVSIFLMGVYIYLTTTEANNKKGEYGFYALALFLLVIGIGNFFAPPPPSEMAIAIAGNSTWLIVAWAYWIDRNRHVKEHT